MTTRPIHILGIGGTFMGGVAQLAAAAGISVTGADQNVYPPMDGQLQKAGIAYHEGYRVGDLPVDRRVVVGNVMRRGMPIVEAMLDRGMSYTSGPQWLAETLLPGRWVLAVAGTHGKTTTASLLAWILEAAGLAPGFLIGGVPQNFGVSARLGHSPFFVIEADEYDCAFFDKRAKFVHYRPRTLVLNNLEFDHADIYPDLAAIERQFHHLVRTVPGQGLLIVESGSAPLERVLAMGCWTPVIRFGLSMDTPLSAVAHNPQASEFTVYADGQAVKRVSWGLTGQHNLANALAALGAARHAGVPLPVAVAALSGFLGVKRRQELRGEVHGIRVLDDFAHHPSAIRLTLDGLRGTLPYSGRLLAVLEPRSNTMRMGVHQDTLGPALAHADRAFVFWPEDLGWGADTLANALGDQLTLGNDLPSLITAVVADARPGDTIVIMSNGGFGGIHSTLLEALRERWHGSA